MLNLEQIKEIIPHREPMLLIDSIVEMNEKSAVGEKNLTGDELFFKGHFPSFPVMPGVFILESLAQVGAVMLLSKEEYKGKLGFYAKIEEAKFRQKVLPGDKLTLKVDVLKERFPLFIVRGHAYVKDKLVAEGKLTFAIGDA